MGQTTDPGHPCGLRARNRERTALRLEQAAWELVAERGFEGLTAEAVAERAGVSRRTFFNYFPRVELVLQERMRHTLAGLADRFAARPVGESLRDSLAAMLTEPFDADLLEMAVHVFGGASTSPAAGHFFLASRAADVAQVTEAIQRRGIGGTDPLRAEVVAQTIIGAAHVATSEWLERSGGVVDDSTRRLHLDLLRQAFEHLFTAFADTDATPLPTASPRKG